MALSNRERFKAIAMGNRPGDVMIIDWFHHYHRVEEISHSAPSRIHSKTTHNLLSAF
jgi:hypothetical protein